MTPYAVENGDISREDFEMFKNMRARVENLPDNLLDGTLISCHHICHALAGIFDVEVVDGRFDRSSQHSWLVLQRRTFEEDGENSLVIADMYPVAGASASLLYTAWCTPWKNMYVKDPDFTKRAITHPDFQRQVQIIRGGLLRLDLPILRKSVA